MKIIRENHDTECGFIVAETDNKHYYYFEYDILEDVDFANEENNLRKEQFYFTRDCEVSSLDIKNYKGKIKPLGEKIEQIGYNKCLINNACLTEKELLNVINELRKDS